MNILSNALSHLRHTKKIFFIIIIIYFHYYSALSKLGLGGTYLPCSVACMPGSRYRGRYEPGLLQTQGGESRVASLE